MKSTMKTMLISLTVLTMLAGTALAAVNILTADRIAGEKDRARQEALAAVLPTFDNNPADETTTTAGGLTLYPATLGGEAAGIAVESFSDNGFSGHITILVGFDTEGTLTGYRVLEHAETPGLGARMGEWFHTPGHDIRGSRGELAVRADGGDVDAITGATITSRAFLEAVNKARNAINNYNSQRQ